MKRKKNTIINLTKKQRDDIKNDLDCLVFRCSLSIHGKFLSRNNSEIASEFKRKFDSETSRYESILNSLFVLGIEIEGHISNRDNVDLLITKGNVI